MKIIIVGMGTKGREWLQIASRQRNVQVVAAVHTDAGSQESAIRLPQSAAAFSRLDEALQVRADAAIISSPPVVRGQHAIQAVNAGLSVMLETPLATTVGEAAEVLSAARARNKRIIVAQESRFGWAEARLREFVRQGRVGQVTHVSVIDRRKQASEDGWPVETNYAQLLDQAVDCFDGLRSVLGANPMTLMALSRKTPWSVYSHGATTESMIEMEQGVHVHYYGSIASARNEHETRIEGDKGVLWTDRKIMWWRKRGWPRFIPLLVKRPRVSDLQNRRVLLEQLRAAVQERLPEASLTESLWPIAMLEAVMQSDRDSRPVDVRKLFEEAGPEVRG
ncbi:MAG: gfo/Idh/MocA family oxidoreductase [Acidobacteria bacterium]|nr:MAG: gfo/Idh/MocA family oxidoreductase [Acidobacteriota bacterium]